MNTLLDMEHNMAKRNEGKKFEEQIKESCPDTILVKKLKDNAAGWSGGNNTRFAGNNECDFIMYDGDLFYGLELKSTEGTSFSFWRKDFPRKDYKIKKCQIEGLEKWSKHRGIYGFLLNFRKYDNRTFFVSIKDFLYFTKNTTKKSIGLKDVLSMNPIEISCKKKKVNYIYDMEKFFRDCHNL